MVFPVALLVSYQCLVFIGFFLSFGVCLFPLGTWVKDDVKAYAANIEVLKDFDTDLILQED